MSTAIEAMTERALAAEQERDRQYENLRRAAASCLLVVPPGEHQNRLDALRTELSQPSEECRGCAGPKAELAEALRTVDVLRHEVEILAKRNADGCKQCQAERDTANQQAEEQGQRIDALTRGIQEVACLWQKYLCGDADSGTYLTAKLESVLAAAVPLQPPIPTTKCLVYQRFCHEHNFTHGAEAEELRQGIERLISNAGIRVTTSALQRLLDRVDARDSLAFREATDAEDEDGGGAQPPGRPSPTYPQTDLFAARQALLDVGMKYNRLLDILKALSAEWESKSEHEHLDGRQWLRACATALTLTIKRALEPSKINIGSAPSERQPETPAPTAKCPGCPDCGWVRTHKDAKACWPAWPSKCGRCTCTIPFGKGPHDEDCPMARPAPPTRVQEEMTPRWRVGRTVGRTLYRDGELVGLMDTRGLAAEIVHAMNVAEESKPQPERPFDPTAPSLLEIVEEIWRDNPEPPPPSQQKEAPPCLDVPDHVLMHEIAPSIAMDLGPDNSRIQPTSPVTSSRVNANATIQTPTKITTPIQQSGEAPTFATDGCSLLSAIRPIVERVAWQKKHQWWPQMSNALQAEIEALCGAVAGHVHGVQPEKLIAFVRAIAEHPAGPTGYIGHFRQEAHSLLAEAGGVHATPEHGKEGADG
ncbi:MAG: hypothetical protein HY369_00555 [Candidatus Aenigmarchaeota archaeon]|nr:hypothetical protein [Candidatus Aenigmarchaeota archaeon]